MHSLSDDYTKALQSYAHMSGSLGLRKDYVQGGGGNTSVKLDDKLMAIKASGYTLAEITPEKGYVTVDYPQIMKYYRTVDVTQDRNFEKESLAASLQSVNLLPGMENKRPSVEVGFHALLKKYVVHTHAVYANILCCSEEGREISSILFADSGFIYIPYIDPGFRLTLAIQNALTEYSAKHGVLPSVIFLENHGVITHADEADEAIALHEMVNSRIVKHFGLNEFPEPVIRPVEQGFVSATAYITAYMQSSGKDEAYFNALKLYPDQLIYLGGKMGGVIQISSEGILYAAGQKEAQAMEETLLGVVYVLDMIVKAGLHLKQMDDKDASFINNWESEKYRSGLIK
jgi:ribulose-5-phosphate 4-epimerase/fuculose-1-phosphate aldolase